MTLRAANPEDAADVVDMIRAQMREERPHFPFSAPAARKAFDECLARGAIIVSTDGADAPVATIAVVQERAPFSDRDWLRAAWCFVRPAHRRAPHMREMLRAARAMGQAAGLAVQIECSGGQVVAGKAGLFRRELGDGDGVTFLVRS